MAEEHVLLGLTSDIVMTHVANNTVALGDVPTLIQKVHEALRSISGEPNEGDEAKKSIVSLKASIKPDYLVCLECGKKHKTLKRHLQSAHGMSPAQYREHFGLPDNYPMVASNYSVSRRAMAKERWLRSSVKGTNGGREAKPVWSRGHRQRSE
jgi:predicted transcriptional regulator